LNLALCILTFGIISTEIDEINKNERIARRRYYQNMERNALPRQESLK
jgi:hypothetical protein